MKRVLTLMTFFLLYVSIYAGRIYVDQTATGNADGSSWSDAYTSLQDAITNSVTGDSIFVATGMYIPDNADPSVSYNLKSGVSLFGGFAGDEDISSFDFASRDFLLNKTVLSGDINKDDVGFENITDNSDHIIMAVGLDTCSIDGFTIAGGHNESINYGAGIYSSNSKISVSNCAIMNNSSGWFGGATAFINCDTVVFVNTVIVNNIINGFTGGGVYADASAVSMTNSVLWSNFKADELDQISLRNEARLYFKNSLVQGSGGSEKWIAGYGIDMGNNIDGTPYFIDYENQNVQLADISPLLGKGDAMYGNNIGQYQFAGEAVDYKEIFVSASATGTNDGTSWENAYTDFNMAIDEAEFYTNIYIAKGVYKPHETDSTKSFSFIDKQGVTVYGGFAGTEMAIDAEVIASRDLSMNETILSGDLKGDDDGLLNHVDNSFHVLFLQRTDRSLLFDGLTISGGSARSTGDNGYGGGMFINGDNSERNYSATFNNVIFKDNYANEGAAFYTDYASVEIKNSLIHNNTADNYGAAFRLHWDGINASRFVNTTIVNNQSTSSNRAAVYSYFSPAEFVNCILWDNATYLSRQIYHFGDITVANSIMQNSGGSEMWNTDHGEDLGGNLDADPMFAETGMDDYKLYAISPAIDNGNQTDGKNSGWDQSMGIPIPFIQTDKEEISFPKTIINTASDEISYMLSGIDLEGDINLMVEGSFEISFISNEYAGDKELMVETVDGKAEKMVYVRYIPSSVEEMEGKIIHTTPNGFNDTVYISGIPVKGTIAISETMFDFGEQLIGQISEVNEIVVEASDIIEDIVVSVPEGYLIGMEMDNVESMKQELLLTPVDSVVNTTIYLVAKPENKEQEQGQLLFKNPAFDDVAATLQTAILYPQIILSDQSLYFDDQSVYMPSRDQAFYIDAYNLINTLYVTGSGPFMISATGDEGFIETDTVKIEHDGNTIINYPLYVKFAPEEAMVYEEQLKIFSDSLDTVYVNVMGEGYIPEPQMETSMGYLQFDPTGLNIPKGEYAYKLTAHNVVDDIIIAAPNGFDLSFTSNEYPEDADSLTIVFDKQIVDTTIYVRYRPQSYDDISGNIIHTTTNGSSVLISVYGDVLSPEIEISEDLIGFGQVAILDTSHLYEVVVSGFYLNADISLQCSEGFEMSVDPNQEDSFSQTLLLSPASHEFHQSIMVRAIPTSEQHMMGQIQISSGDMEGISIELNAEVLLPELYINNDYIDFGDIMVNDSPEEYFTVTAYNLASDLILTPPAGFAISEQSGDAFVAMDEIVISPENAMISEYPVYVQFKPMEEKEYSGNISFNAEFLEPYTVQLVGNGLLPMPYVETSMPIVDFGNTDLQSETQVLSFEVYSENVLSALQIASPSTEVKLSLDETMEFAESIELSAELLSDGFVTVFVSFMPETVGEKDVQLQITGTKVDKTVKVNAIVNEAGKPVIDISHSFINFDDVIVGTEVVNSFTVSAQNLKSDITIGVGDGYMISIDNEVFVSDAIILNHTEGAVAETAIYVKYISEMVDEVAAEINLSSVEAISRTVWLFGNGKIVPTMDIDDSPLMFGSIIVGETSNAKMIHLIAENIYTPFTISAPEGFEISLNENYGYSGMLTINDMDGMVDTDIYVRFDPSISTDYDGQLIIINEELDDVEISVTGTGVNRPTHVFVNDDATGNNNGISWKDAFNDLQTAFTKVRAGDSIFVAKGVYTPSTSDRNKYFAIPTSVRVIGGFIGNEVVNAEAISNRDWETNATILSGDLQNDDAAGNKTDNSYHIVVFDAEYQNISTNTQIDGFIITNGYADGAFTDYYGSYASGIFIKSGYKKEASPTIKNCIVENNYGKVFGGGMAIFPSTSQTTCNPVITNVTFRNNEAGQDGGGVYISGSIGKVSPVFTNVYFYGNMAQNGGAIYNRGACEGICSPTYTNIIVCNNSASYYGGGIYNISTDEGGSCENVAGTCTPRFINATITNNSSGYKVGGVYNKQDIGVCAPTFINTIIWDNTPSSVITENANASFSNSIVEGSGGSELWTESIGVDGGSNYDANPLFVEGNGCDLRLLNESMALGNGNQNYGINIGYYQEEGLDNPPVISVSGNVPSFGEVPIGSVSSEYSVMLTAKNITDKVIVTVPEGFEISLNNGAGFINTNPLEIVAVDGTIPVTEIFVRFVPAEEINYTGVVEFSTDGGNMKTVNISGTGKFFNPYIYVKHDADGNADGSSWDDAFNSLQDALRNFEQNKIIVVAKGKYTPHTISRDVYFNIYNGMKIYGGFEGTEESITQEVINNRDFITNETILSGDLYGNDNGFNNNGENSYHVLMIYAENADITNSTIIDGFTIEGGNAEDYTFEGEGGGIFVCADYSQKVTPVLRNLVVRNNSSQIDGGGIAITHKSSNGESSALLENIVFENNKSQKGGGLALGSGFSINKTVGKNLWFTQNAATLEGGAIHVSSLCSGITEPHFENVTICSNSALDGTAIANEAGETYNGCSTGGGRCNPTFVNISITNNAGFQGEAVYSYVEEGTCTPNFVNAIIGGNDGSAQQVHNLTGANATFKNSLVQGSGGSSAWSPAIGSDLGGNIDADPLFVSGNDCDLKLKAQSPAIASGDAEYGINMGSYQGEGIILPPSLLVSHNSIDFGEVIVPVGATTYSFIVSGTDLKSAISISATSAYEISLAPGGDFEPLEVIELEPVLGTVTDTEIHVRFVPPVPDEYIGEITISSSEVESKFISLTGIASSADEPKIYVTQKSLDAGKVYQGGKSYIMGFEFSTENITDQVVISSPDNVAISTEFAEFEGTNEIIIAASEGYASAIIYVQISPTKLGTESSVIELMSDGARTKSVIVHAETVAPPVTELSVNSITYEQIEKGSVSDPVEVQINITDLVDNITITPPAGFEIAVGDPVNFTSNTTMLYEVSGAVNESIYLKFSPQSAGDFDGNLELISQELVITSLPIDASATGAPGITVVEYASICQGTESITIPFTLLDENTAEVIVETRIERHYMAETAEMLLEGTNDVRTLTIDSEGLEGEYTVWLVATDNSALKDSAAVEIYIMPKPSFSFENHTMSSCDNADEIYVGFYAMDVFDYTVELDGANVGNQSNFIFSESGTHTFSLIDNASGCRVDTVADLVMPEAFMVDLLEVTNQTDSKMGSVEFAISGGSSPYYIDYNGMQLMDETTVTGLSEGYYYMYVYDNYGCGHSFDINIEYNTTAVDDVENDYKVYPTICTDVVYVNTNNTISISISIIDNKGAELLSQESTAKETAIDVSSLTDGIYEVIVDDGVTTYSKFIIKDN